MNFIEVIFELLDAFGAVSEKKYSWLKQKANDWYYAVIEKRPLPEGEPVPPEVVIGIVQKYSEPWYWQLCWAVGFVFLKQYLHRVMHPEEDSDNTNLGA